MAIGDGGDTAVVVGVGNGGWRRQQWWVWVMVVVGLKGLFFC